MTEGQFYAVAGALRERLERAGHHPSVLEADEVTQLLRVALPRRGVHVIDVRSLDLESDFDAEITAGRLMDLCHPNEDE